MKTKIYKTYADFLKRDNKSENGVSKSFAQQNPTYEKDNEMNTACFNCYDCSRCSDCSHCSGCYDCSDCTDCYRCSDCSDCSDCYNCSDCSGCFDCFDCFECSDCFDCNDCSRCTDCTNCSHCYDCYRCSDCFGCSDCSDKKGDTTFPIIPNIHQAVLKAVTATPKSLDMETWHTCATTHCRAGWVVTLAGEAGEKLEKETTTAFTAFQIYKASSPIKVTFPRFFETDKEAMADIKRCAAEEVLLNTK